MSFLPTSNEAGIIVGIYLVNAVVAPLAIFYQVRLAAFKRTKPCALLEAHQTNQLLSPSGLPPTSAAPRSAPSPPPSSAGLFPSGTSLDPRHSRRVMRQNTGLQSWR